jgi:SAM-dependent methyltransferase
MMLREPVTPVQSVAGGSVTVSGQQPLFSFACPSCRTPLEAAGPDVQRCPADGSVYRREAGIWRFLLPERFAYFAQFIAEYEQVREAEGRGAKDRGYYRALPFEDHSGHHVDEWRIRATSFQALQQRVVAPLEKACCRPLQVLDLGAGNAWLSHRLAQRGHRLAAVDLLTNEQDGWGAHVHYELRFTSVQAEFARLPFVGGQVDLAVFNGALHYSASYDETLREALRVLRDDGRLVIMDSPVYHMDSSGRLMVDEREYRFKQAFGFPSNAIPSENYLTHERLRQLADILRVEWQISMPFYGLRWALRAWRARLLGHREPASFLLIVGRRRWP